MTDWKKYRLEHDGKKYTVKELYEMINITENSMRARLLKYIRGKKPIEYVFKKRPSIQVTLPNGEIITAKDWQAKTGVLNYGTMTQRFCDFRHGRISLDAFMAPLQKRCQKRAAADAPIDKMTPERQAALKKMETKSMSLAYMRQEELMPLGNTPAFRNENGN